MQTLWIEQLEIDFEIEQSCLEAIMIKNTNISRSINLVCITARIHAVYDDLSRKTTDMDLSTFKEFHRNITIELVSLLDWLKIDSYRYEKNFRNVAQKINEKL